MILGVSVVVVVVVRDAATTYGADGRGMGRKIHTILLRYGIATVHYLSGMVKQHTIHKFIYVCCIQDLEINTKSKWHPWSAFAGLER